MGLRAVLVSVDYTDCLKLSLPWNRSHFDTVTVITSTADAPNVKPICEANNADVIVTDLFYARKGDVFAKWPAMEFGLDCIGRKGWLCVMDADVLWPKNLEVFIPGRPNICEFVINGCAFLPGMLYSPLRRMYHTVPQNFDQIPPESEWSKYPIHKNIAEWAGYTQIFHASDPVLGPPPWHDITWKTAGGADSFFQAKWPRERKVRPPFEVLHMGPAGANWCGRATPYADGTVPPESGKRAAMVGNIWEKRQRLRKEGRDQFEGEKG